MVSLWACELGMSGRRSQSLVMQESYLIVVSMICEKQKRLSPLICNGETKVCSNELEFGNRTTPIAFCAWPVDEKWGLPYSYLN